MTWKLMVLVIEDHDDLRDATVAMLRKAGFDAVGVACAEDVDDTPLPRTPELYVVDLNLPGEDGLSLATRLRAGQPLAGIVITTARGLLSDRLLGYAVGADMYLPKPVDPMELVAALNALANRLRQQNMTAELRMDAGKALLIGPAGSCSLSDSEVRLLAALAKASDRTLERWQVSSQLQGNDEEISADNLQVRISQLRKKIRICGIEQEPIKAIRGSGYRLSVPLVVV
jgi:DNA-binding response OmpR family regulator